MVKSKPLMEKSKNTFNHLKIHTQYSICEGAIKIDDLAEYCKNNKIKSLGLTDTLNLCGALEFSEKLSKVGTQPIIGTQINLKSQNIVGKITLYAKTEEGYKNLTKLSSLSTPILCLIVTGKLQLFFKDSIHFATFSGSFISEAPKFPEQTLGLGQPTLKLISS